jgi:hypothetical protein
MLAPSSSSPPRPRVLASLALPGQEKKPAGALLSAAAADHFEMSHGVRAWHVQLELARKFDPEGPAAASPASRITWSTTRSRKKARPPRGLLFESGDSEKTGGVMILKAKDEKAIREKFANDPIFTGGVMKIGSVHPMIVGRAWMPKEKEASGAKCAPAAGSRPGPARSPRRARGRRARRA